jgi:hypothetical protein
MKLTLNMNDTVKVRLTPFGREVLRKNHDELFKDWKTPYPYTPPYEKDGVSQWQLWTLFQEFGRVISLGQETPFDNDIEVISR